MTARLRRALPAVVGFVLFLGALAVLASELRAYSWQSFARDALRIPRWRVTVALMLTGLNYLVLTGYDRLAFKAIGRSLPARRIMLTSFLAYAVANNVGFSALSGASVRYRFYCRWGISASELSRIVVAYSVTFWLGLLFLGGVVLVRAPLGALGVPHIPGQALGWLLLAATAGYLLARPSLAFTQLILSVADWILAAAILYVLLPAGALAWTVFLGAFLTAMLVGMVSHVPGGAGVFEGMLTLLLAPYLTGSQLLPVLAVYRAIYYLAPLALALAGLAADEFLKRRDQAARVGAVLGELADTFTPRLLSALTFIAGLVLLLSGATPAVSGRLAALARVFPLGVIEISHFAGSVVGVALLLLSQGLARRLDAARYLSLGAIGIGIAATLVKGLDYEEALLLTVVFGLLWRARRVFTRRAALFETRFSPEWIAALAAAIASSIWLGLFSYKHVSYSSELWWQFELHGEASRFLRASVGVAIVVLLFGLERLLRYPPHAFVAPTDEELAEAGRVIARQGATTPNLVYLRDKSIIFSEDRSAFLMYGVQGRTWAAMGDPVGNPERMTEVIRAFLERCDDFGGIPVFYEVSADHLHRYADFGLTVVKLGEEARVDLSSLTLAGGTAARQRQVLRRLEKEGVGFRLVAPADVPALLPRLRVISNEWLAAKTGAEKGFSLGFFDEEYVSRFPVAVLEREGRILAFANVWTAAGHQELSLDLMRYAHDAPKSAMEGLLIHLQLWGKAEAYRWLALGMAPLAGVGGSPSGSRWNRIGAFLYAHAEPIYQFQGLRAFKEKFHPVWVARYLAYPGGLRLPLILADVSALIAGGYRQVFRRPAESSSRHPVLEPAHEV